MLTPHYPQSNGHAEAPVKSVKHLIQKVVSSGNLGCDALDRGLLKFCNTPLPNKKKRTSVAPHPRSSPVFSLFLLPRSRQDFQGAVASQSWKMWPSDRRSSLRRHVSIRRTRLTSPTASARRCSLCLGLDYNELGHSRHCHRHQNVPQLPYQNVQRPYLVEEPPLPPPFHIVWRYPVSGGQSSLSRTFAVCSVSPLSRHQWHDRRSRHGVL